MTSVLLPLPAAATADHAVLAGASDRRRREFATGRACARDALGQLGVPEVKAVLSRDDDGLPVWPAGYVGSISHTDGWVGAVSSRSTRWRGPVALGLDAEPARPLGADVIDVVATRDERRRLRDLASAHPEINWDAAMFVAKEAAYKAWFPVGREVLGHDRVLVDLSPGGRFSASVTPRRARRRELRGRWVAGAFVVAIAALPG